MNALGARKWWAAIALALAVLAGGLDLTVLNLALPTLATDLHASTAELQWIVDAYSLVLAASLLPAGLLGDRFGRKRLLLFALTVFGFSSLACAYANSATQLIIARTALGLSAAFVFSLALAVLPVLFSEEERQRGVLVVMGATIVAYPIGPVLGGYLLTHFWWGSVFLINVPVTAIGLIAVAALLPESRAEHRPRLDLIGVLASSAGLALVTFGVIEAGEKGWGRTGALLEMAGGAVLLAAFVAWQQWLRRRGAEALVDLSLFGSARFTWGTILSTAVSFAMFGLLFTVPQYFQSVLGVDAMGSGIRLLPIVGGLLVGGAIADRAGSRLGVKVSVALGFSIMAVGLFMGTQTGTQANTGYTAAWIAAVGVGLGFAIPAAMNAALGQLSAERSGVGSGLISAVRQVGAAFGVAILGSILNSVYRHGLDLTGVPAPVASAARDSLSSGARAAEVLHAPALLASVRSAFVHGMDVMLWVCGGIAVACLVLALAFLPRGSRDELRASPEETRTADEVVV